MSTKNLLLRTDSYKHTHWLQYPVGSKIVFSYIESRGGIFDKTLFFGLQAFIKEYLTTPITLADINEADELVATHIGPNIFNRTGWEYILSTHAGYLPLCIKAVPEGLVIPTSNVLVTVENTDPNCYWLTSFVETALLRAVWYPTTVATTSWSIKQIIRAALEETGDPTILPFRLHDFGSRGVSSSESAGLGGMAHLVNFMGTDTIEALLYARKFYGEPMSGFSIPAAEHSTITPFGRAGEADAYRNMIEKFSKPGSIYAVVSDSYDIFNAVENLWGGELKEQVIKSGGTLVVRPDSGHPSTVVLKIVQLLDKKFGSVVNDKGFKVLNNVRVIQGDGINETSIKEIIAALKSNQYSIDNLAFGMGGALLQGINRDTQKMAMKCSWIDINGIGYDVFKDPITDSGKRSKKGRIKLVRSQLNGTYFTVREDTLIMSPTDDVLVEVFRDGKIVKEYTFAEVRANSNKE